VNPGEVDALVRAYGFPPEDAASRSTRAGLVRASPPVGRKVTASASLSRS